MNRLRAPGPVQEPRLAKRGDAPAIGQVHAAAWRAAYTGFFSADELQAACDERVTGWTIQQVEAKKRDGALLVIDDYLGVCGYTFAVPGEVRALYLHPRAWGTGVASDLLWAAVHSQAIHSSGDMRLWAFARSDRAQRFYVKQGWKLTGRFKMSDVVASEPRVLAEYQLMRPTHG